MRSSWMWWGLLLACGCSQPAAPVPTSAEKTQTAPEQPAATLPEQSEPVLSEPVAQTPQPSPEPLPAAPAPTELKIDTLDWDQTQAIVAAHPGKVVVLDLWATYCPPCLKELPGLVALQAKHPDQVHCVSVCLDFDGDPKIPPATLEPDIRLALEKVKAHKIQNVILNIGSDELLKRVQRGSMPIVFVFDASGNRVHTFPDLDTMDEATYEEHITPAVEALLSTTPSK